MKDLLKKLTEDYISATDALLENRRFGEGMFGMPDSARSSPVHMEYYNAVEAAKVYNANISDHRATNIRDSRIKEMDIILCATVSHKQTITYIYPELKGKVYTMKEYAKIDKNGENMDIKDPWGYNMDVYYNCVDEIYECLDKTIKILK